MHRNSARPGFGFTLIELLIVVAIIAILAAIAVPNFLEAQSRSKISRAKSDMRTVGVALESYTLDYNAYPIWSKFKFTEGSDGAWEKASMAYPFIGYTPGSLTTPVSYLTSLPKEMFSMRNPKNPNPLNLFMYDSVTNCHYFYWVEGVQYMNWDIMVSMAFRWTLVSYGPDQFTTIANDCCGPTNNLYEIFQDRSDGIQGVLYFYDPTNGTVSRGDIIHIGPSGGFDYPQTIKR